MGWYRACFFATLFICLPWVPMVHGHAAWQQGEIPLSEALNRLGNRHGVRFAYDRELVAGIRVPEKSVAAGSSLDATLEKLLAPHGLTCRKALTAYYTIQRAAPAESLAARAQPARRVSGTIRLQDTQAAVPYASIQLMESGLATQAAQDGTFVLGVLRPGRYSLQVRSISIVPKTWDFTVDESAGDVHLDVEVQLNQLDLDEVRVTAQEQQAGEATSSRIDARAIEHLQATSLADVLQLTPGALMTNPSLTSVNRVALRQLSVDNIGSLGTGLYINGAPVSNNANMQLSGLPTSGVLGAYQTTAGSGVDFRHFSADNIESVEVIRGIPSVEYGDITAGAVVVKTKTGKSPLQTKLRITPNIFQVSGTKGIDLDRNAGLLNIDLDYTRAVSDQRFDVNSFDRYTVGLQHEKRFGHERPLLLTTNLNYRANIGQQKLDPDDEAETRNYARDYNYRFNMGAKWNSRYRFAENIHVQLAVDYSDQYGYQQALVGGNVFPVATAMEPTEAVPTVLVPGLYLNQTTIEGQPLTVFLKVTNNFTVQTGGMTHRILAGAEWRTEDNTGQGKQYDPTRPPRLNNSGSSRERSYAEIPALNMLSLYLEDRAEARLWGRRFTVQAGVRFDNVQPESPWQSEVGLSLSPRVNVSYALFDGFQLRGGYGLAAKAPTLAYLYPQPAYYDYIVLNHYTDNPAERLILATTRVFNRDEPQLKIAYNTKRELGFAYDLPWANIRATAYHELTRNGYEYMQTLASLQRVFVNRYQVLAANPGSQPTVNPVPVGVDTVYTDYTVPTNGRRNVNRGVEFDVDFGRIDALRTSFMVNGAWMQSRTESTGPYIVKQSPTGGGNPDRVGVYGTGRGNVQERFNTTLRVIHHIPQFRLVASLAIQTVWLDRHDYIGYDRIAQGYYSKQTGTVHWFSPAERAQLDYMDLANREVTLAFTDEYFLTESWKPNWLFNLRLTKEISNQLGFSFFANNVFMHNPLQQNTRWANQYNRRGQDFLFGAEMNFRF